MSAHILELSCAETNDWILHLEPFRKNENVSKGSNMSKGSNYKVVAMKNTAISSFFLVYSLVGYYLLFVGTALSLAIVCGHLPSL